MSINELFDGRWHEYSGGSRPGSNLLRCSTDSENHLIIEISYVFDFNTGETELLSFDLPPEYFQQLVEELSPEGYSCISVKDKIQDFIFELRLAGERLEFRVRGTPKHSVSGPLQLEMRDFQEIANMPFETRQSLR